MASNAAVHVIGLADVERVVCASKNVDEVHVSGDDDAIVA